MDNESIRILYDLAPPVYTMRAPPERLVTSDRALELRKPILPILPKNPNHSPCNQACARMCKRKEKCLQITW